MNNLIFKTFDDYKFGMNSIPIAQLSTGVVIYCFTLMSNHAHFLLFGTRNQVIRFYNEWKSRVGKHLVNTPISYETHRQQEFVIRTPIIGIPHIFISIVAYSQDLQ